MRPMTIKKSSVIIGDIRLLGNLKGGRRGIIDPSKQDVVEKGESIENGNSNT